MGFLLWLEHCSPTPDTFSDAAILHEVTDSRGALPGEALESGEWQMVVTGIVPLTWEAEPGDVSGEHREP